MSRPDEAEVRDLAARFTDAEPQTVLRWAIGQFGERLAIASSLQAESVVLVDLARRIDPRVRVFTLDTGRLPQETFDFIDRVRQRLGVAVEVVLPDPAEVAAMVAHHGANLFRQSVEQRLLCCRVRKSQPLARYLEGLDAWVTGLRRDQAESRSSVGAIEFDRTHGGILKLNPLVAWSQADVWAYERAHDLPHHALYDQGYTSIGCACCTRATRAGEDVRAGRWWWEQSESKECGIHGLAESDAGHLPRSRRRCGVDAGGPALRGRADGHCDNS